MSDAARGPAADQTSVLTLLDACAVISLFATRRMGDILDEVDGPVAVVDLVLRESLYVRRGGSGEDARDLEPIDLIPFQRTGRLAVIKVEDEAELKLLIELVEEFRLDDGEAMTAAVAINRGCVMVTDDGKAERRLSGRVALRSSLDLIKTWADGQAIAPAVVAAALMDVYERRSYLPPARHPLKGWWDSLVGNRS